MKSTIRIEWYSLSFGTFPRVIQSRSRRIRLERLVWTCGSVIVCITGGGQVRRSTQFKWKTSRRRDSLFISSWFMKGILRRDWLNAGSRSSRNSMTISRWSSCRRIYRNYLRRYLTLTRISRRISGKVISRTIWIKYSRFLGLEHATISGSSSEISRLIARRRISLSLSLSIQEVNLRGLILRVWSKMVKAKMMIWIEKNYCRAAKITWTPWRLTN